MTKLSSSVIVEQEEAVISLRKLTRTKEELRVSLCTPRLLSALRSLIVSHYSTVQVNAAASLVNLSLEKPNKVKIVRSGFIPPLVDVLKSGSGESQEHAAGALFSLALEEDNKMAIGVLGALPISLSPSITGSCSRLYAYRKYSGDTFIASFDMATELFGEVMMPEALQSNRCTISKYGDSLALIKHYGYNCRDQENCGCDIWVMKEYGVTESWTYLYKIAVDLATIHGFKRCGEVVLSERNNRGRSRMISLDPKSKQVQVFGNKDYIYYFMDSFVESLILLDHINAISYR